MQNALYFIYVKRRAADYELDLSGKMRVSGQCAAERRLSAPEIPGNRVVQNYPILWLGTP